MLARCTSSLDLHMLIVPYWYLFRTLLVPKVALGIIHTGAHTEVHTGTQTERYTDRQVYGQTGTQADRFTERYPLRQVSK